MGVHISFVRSIEMDSWKPLDLKRMEVGGNKLAKAYYEKNGMISNGKVDHHAAALAKYKMDLTKRA